MAEYESDIMKAVHETASAMRDLGFIDKRKMHEYNLLCLKELPEFDAPHIKSIREKLNMSQAVLASALNISLSTVRQWEQGRKKPSGPSQKLLALIDKKGIESIIL